MGRTTGCFMVLIIILLSIFSQIQSQNVPLRILTTDLKASLLDPQTGQISCSSDLDLPPPSSGCQWKFPLIGTRGQTSAIFYENQTNFVTGQVVCADGTIARSNVFQLFGPYSSCATTFNRIYPLYYIDPAVSLDDINLSWDHTCNVVVLQPQQLSNGTLITTKQVSEYDAQVRPQVDYFFNEKDCENCWLKVKGLGALDYGSYNSIWNPELNCGDSCLFYSLEEQIVNGQATPPRALIGRSFRTQALAINVTDSIQAQTLSWSPLATFRSPLNQFLGIGICCTETWCHAGCTGLDSHLVLFSFLPYQKGQEISILADIGNVIDQDAIRLGVEYSPMFQTTNQMAYVYYQQTIISFALTVQNGLITAALKTRQSPRLETDAEIVVWATGFPG